MELLRALIPLLYFDYEVAYPLSAEETGLLSPLCLSQLFTLPESAPTPLLSQRLKTQESQIQPETTESESLQDPPPSLASSLDHQPSSSTGETLLFIHHLDKFVLPPGYPQSIADIIRAMTTPAELSDTFRPTRLSQILKIGSDETPSSRLALTYIRAVALENGPVVRRREIEEKRRLERLEEERRQRIWRETPKRFKGLMSGKCIRRYGKFLIVSSYRSLAPSLPLSLPLSLSLSPSLTAPRMPLKPTVMSLKGHVFDECQKLAHFLDLGSIGQAHGIHLNPRKWDDDLAKLLCRKATRLLTSGESTRSTLFLKYETKTGSEVQLASPKSCAGFESRRGVSSTRSFPRPSLPPSTSRLISSPLLS
jgi:hypothetical protein